MRHFAIFLLAAIGVFIIDQNIKALFLEGYYREGRCIKRCREAEKLCLQS